MKSAINMAWEHGGADFQSRFDKSTAQAEQMKEGGALRGSVTGAKRMLKRSSISLTPKFARIIKNSQLFVTES